MRRLLLNAILLLVTVMLGLDKAHGQAIIPDGERSPDAELQLSRLIAQSRHARPRGFSLMPSYRNLRESAFSITPMSVVNNQTVFGTGTVGRLTRWTGFTNGQALIGNSTIFEDGFGRVGVGTETPTSRLTVAGLIQSTTGGFKFPDGTVQTTAGIAPSQVVRSLNGMMGDLSLVPGSNITIAPSGNSLTIASTASGLGSVAHDATLAGDGTASSPLGVRVPLILSGSVAGVFKGVIQAINFAEGNGVVAVGGDSDSNFAGDGVIAFGGESNSGFVGGSGVTAFGGNHNGDNGGHGVFAFGGESNSGVGGLGALAEGGAGNSGGTGILATGGLGEDGVTLGPAGRFSGLTVCVRVQVVASFPFRLLLFDCEFEFARRRVRADARHLPADFHVRTVGPDREAIAVDLFGYDGLGESADDGELVAEVAVHGLEPFGQLNYCLTIVVGDDVAGVQVEDFGRFYCGVKQILVFRIERMIYFEVLGSGDVEVAINRDIPARSAAFSI